jgi:hypothetical protein
MTFSNDKSHKREKNIIILPYNSITHEQKPSIGELRSSERPRKVNDYLPDMIYHRRIIESTSSTRGNLVGLPNNKNEYQYNMKTNMIGRIMNNKTCYRCPKQ